MKKIITIDGAACSGKSSLSRELSKKLGWPWLSTGVFYRGIACAGHKEDLKEEKDWLTLIRSNKWEVRLSQKQSLFFYKGKDITDQLYQRQTDELASLFSCNTIFRKALLDFQRDVFKRTGSLITEGRDCGTVLFPNAPLKIFLMAGDHIRAERRARDRKTNTERVLKDQKYRDLRDQRREFAPLKQPEGSLAFDTGKHSLDEILNKIHKEALLKFF